MVVPGVLTPNLSSPELGVTFFFFLGGGYHCVLVSNTLPDCWVKMGVQGAAMPASLSV